MPAAEQSQGKGGPAEGQNEEYHEDKSTKTMENAN
jgi:hypothetical protein